jgi:hypothetical protein
MGIQDWLAPVLSFQSLVDKWNMVAFQNTWWYPVPQYEQKPVVVWALSFVAPCNYLDMFRHPPL